MTEPIDQATQIKNEAEQWFKNLPWMESYKFQLVKEGYIAGATNSFKYLEKLLNEKLYKEVESLREQLAKLETQSHDQVRIIEHLEQELVKERELRKELVSIVEYYHDKQIQYTGMPYKNWNAIIKKAKEL